MINNKIKVVKANTENKYKKSYNQQVRPPKVHFDISKKLRIHYDVLKIEPESAEMPELKTICDIDKSFYKVIDGRPIRQYLDVKVYIRTLRDVTLLRADAAYLNDLIVQIDANITDELEQYNDIYKLYNITTENFFNFIEESYDAAKKAQECAEAKSKELANKVNQLNRLSFALVKKNNKISRLASVFGSLFRYGYFLNHLSPIWWTTQNGIINSDEFINVYKEAESNPTQSFEIYKAYFVHPSVKTKIYFKKPQQLIRIFDYISMQCLNYMKIQTYSASIVKPVLKSRDQLEIKVLTEINEVTDLIDFYEQRVKWVEQKEAEYKSKFNKLLYKEFHELYASYKSTKLFTCVQRIHFRLFQGQEDPWDNITTLVRDIEKLFVNLTSKLDGFDQKVVKNAKYEVFASDIKLLKRASEAQRILKECDIFKKKLISSFEAPRYLHKKMTT